jgi:hypothetical protein
MKFNTPAGLDFVTLESLHSALLEVFPSVVVRFEVDGEILHPVRFGTYPDPMAVPDQFIFMAKDAPEMTAGELIALIDARRGREIADETGGIEGIAHDMVHVMGMVLKPDGTNHMPLSLLDFQENHKGVTITASSDWWIGFEKYYDFRTGEGKDVVQASFEAAQATQAALDSPR